MKESTKKAYYPKESAGRLMAKNVPIVQIENTVGEVEKVLIKESKKFESINYVYIVDSHDVLKGVISIRELFINPNTTPIKKIMTKELITVRSHTDQEKITRIAIANNLKNVPVVDESGHLLGVVLSDTILNILHEENTEDILRSAGISKSENPSQALLKSNAYEYLKKRLPWLVFGLVGGMFAAIIIGFFEEMLSELIVLAAFLPAVVYMADAVGSQTQTIFIRSLTMDSSFKNSNYYHKEAIVTSLLAVILGLIAMIVVALWWQNILLGVILGISFFFTILASSATAIALPLLFNKINLDPAIASGPFATVIRDIMSILIYLLVIYLFLPLLII